MSNEPDADFFISYSRTEQELMLANILRPINEVRLSAWHDERLAETIMTDRWWDEIVRQIDSTKAFVFLFTDRWQKSEICQREYSTALQLKKEMVPVEIEEFDYVNKLAHITQTYQISKLFLKNGRHQFLTRLKSIAARAASKHVANSTTTGSIETILRTLKKEAVDQSSTLRVLGAGGDFKLRDVFQQLRVEGYPSGRSIAASELIAQDRRQKVLLLGIPGSGKSTLLQFLQLSLGESAQSCVPLRYSARWLVSHLRDRELSEWTQDHLVGRTHGQIEIAPGGTPIPGAHLVLMIDGLDEIAESQYEELSRTIQRFIDVYPGVSVFLTSRFEGIALHDFSDFEVFRIAELANPDIRRYVEATVPADSVEQVWTAIIETPELNELCRTPFMLAMVCAAHSELGGRATQRATIYRRCVSYLLREVDWQSDRSLSPPQEVERLRNALKFLALRFFKLDSSGSFRESEIIETIKLIPGFEQDAKRLLRQIVQGTGLLQADRDRYQFVHRTIWEYFVAEGCRDEPFDAIVERANARHWEEPIRLLAGLLSEPDFDRFVRLLWPRNTGLALRTMTELSTIPYALLKDLYSGCKREERIRIVQEVRTLASLSGDTRRKEKLVCDTISVLLAVERSAEFVFHFIELLQSVDSPACKSLVSKVLDLANLQSRVQRYLSDPSFSLKFVRIPSGRFLMGVEVLPDGREPDASERPAHEVELSEYEIADRLVTNKLFYDGFPYALDRRDSYSSADNQPVNNLTWYEAKVFALWLGCDLPTDAEWECAARAGGKDDALLNDHNQLPDYAWHGDNSGNRTHDVGTKLPNSFGMYDVAGNLREWCNDWFNAAYYGECKHQGCVRDPRGPESGDRKVLRGGTFDWALTNLRPTYRNFNVPNLQHHVTGMRLVRRCVKG